VGTIGLTQTIIAAAVSAENVGGLERLNSGPAWRAVTSIGDGLPIWKQ